MSYKGRRETPTKSLRGEKKPTFTEFPIGHQLVLGVLSEVCASMKDGYYQGKLTSTGGVKVTIYQDEENTTDYFSYLDDPVQWLTLVCENCWGAAVTREALLTYARRAGKKPQEVANAIEAMPR